MDKIPEDIRRLSETQRTKIFTAILARLAGPESSGNAEIWTDSEYILALYSEFMGKNQKRYEVTQRVSVRYDIKEITRG